jgi:5,10-methylenetetrahydromethanopterin reductase
VRQLLAGERVSTQGDQVNLDQLQMQLTPDDIPPLYIGAMREKTFRLAGRVGDGTIFTAMSSPEYIRWALGFIRAGMAEAGRTQHHTVVYLDVKVGPDGSAARAAARQCLAARLPWADSQMEALGIADEVTELLQVHGTDGLAERMPDAWLDAFAAARTPEQVIGSLQGWTESGADTIVLQPLNGDPACLDEYIRYLMPILLKEDRTYDA